jgi:hypothetical protein
LTVAHSVAPVLVPQPAIDLDKQAVLAIAEVVVSASTEVRGLLPT